LLKYFTSDADAKNAKILLCKADLYININIKQITERIIPIPYIQNTFDIDTQLE